MTRRARAVPTLPAAAAAAAAVLLATAPAAGADTTRVDTLAPDTTAEAAWPFRVGERATYAVTLGPVKVGGASLAVEAADTIRGTPTWRVAMALRGGTFFYHLDDRQVSWIAPRPFRSLRFEQHLREGSYRRDRRYCLDQRAGRYWRFDRADDGGWRSPPGDDDRDEGMPMPPAALDEIAFLYFARTLSLAPGTTYRFARYFEAEGNPVVLEVLRRETITVPAGRFRTVVVHPIIRTGGDVRRGGQGGSVLQRRRTARGGPAGDIHEGGQAESLPEGLPAGRGAGHRTARLRRPRRRAQSIGSAPAGISTFV